MLSFYKFIYTSILGGRGVWMKRILRDGVVHTKQRIHQSLQYSDLQFYWIITGSHFFSSVNAVELLHAATLRWNCIWVLYTSCCKCFGYALNWLLLVQWLWPLHDVNVMQWYCWVSAVMWTDFCDSFSLLSNLNYSLLRQKKILWYCMLSLATWFTWIVQFVLW